MGKDINDKGYTISEIAYNTGTYSYLSYLLGIDIDDIDIIYDIDIIPMGYVRRTRADSWRNRDVVNRYYVFKNTLSYLLNVMGYKQSNVLNIAFLLPIPHSVSKKKYRELELCFHDKKPDLDNLIKSFLDAVCKQDNYICKINCLKLYSKTPKIIIFTRKSDKFYVSVPKTEHS